MTPDTAGRVMLWIIASWIVEEPGFAVRFGLSQRCRKRGALAPVPFSSFRQLFHSITAGFHVTIDDGHQAQRPRVDSVPNRELQFSDVTPDATILPMATSLECKVARDRGELDGMADDRPDQRRDGRLVSRSIADEMDNNHRRATNPSSPRLNHTSPSMNSSRKVFNRSRSAGSAVRLPSSSRRKTRT